MRHKKIKKYCLLGGEGRAGGIVFVHHLFREAVELRRGRGVWLLNALTCFVRKI